MLICLYMWSMAAFALSQQNWVLQQRLYNPRNLQYLLSGPYRRMFADPCSSSLEKALTYLKEEWARKGWALYMHCYFNPHNNPTRWRLSSHSIDEAEGLKPTCPSWINYRTGLQPRQFGSSICVVNHNTTQLYHSSCLLNLSCINDVDSP